MTILPDQPYGATTMRNIIILFSLLACMSLAGPALAESNMDPALHEKAKRATDAGLHYLREQQAEDGSWSNSVGITALALRAFLESYRKYNEGDGPSHARYSFFSRISMRTVPSVKPTRTATTIRQWQ